MTIVTKTESLNVQPNTWAVKDSDQQTSDMVGFEVTEGVVLV